MRSIRWYASATTLIVFYSVIVAFLLYLIFWVGVVEWLFPKLLGLDRYDWFGLGILVGSILLGWWIYVAHKTIMEADD